MLKPCKQRWKLAPEGVYRRQGGKLVAEHDAPVRLQLFTKGRERCQSRKWNCLECAFLRQGIVDDRSRRMKLVVQEKVDHIVEIAGARTLGKRPYFFSEDLFIAVAAGMHAGIGAVGGGVRNGPVHRRQYQHFVDGQVELDSRQATGGRSDGPAIGDPPLSGGAASPILKDFEMHFVGRQFNAGLFVNPGTDFTKGRYQEINAKMRFIRQREVEIFREAIGFEVAFLETGSAFEYPSVLEGIVVEDACKDPAQNVVLFHDIRQQPEIAGAGKKFAAIN